MSTAHAELAILGGRPAVPAGSIKNWPPIDDLDRKLVLESLEGDNHAFGPNCAAFEKEFAAWNGNAFAITTNSGTAALHMAVAACGLRRGRPRARHRLLLVLQRHLHPPPQLHPGLRGHRLRHDEHGRRRRSRRPSRRAPRRSSSSTCTAWPWTWTKVLAIARKHGLKVIEDACQAHGATVQRQEGRHVGRLRGVQLQPEQVPLLRRGRHVRHRRRGDLRRRRASSGPSARPARPPESRDYHAYALGWMYRNNDLTAAFGRAQLTRLDEYLAVQRENAALLKKSLRKAQGPDPAGGARRATSTTGTTTRAASTWRPSAGPATRRGSATRS